MFAQLDDISLWAASRVCRRWGQLIEQSVSNQQWNHFTFRRWPLFRPNYAVAEWAQVFSNLYYFLSVIGSSHEYITMRINFAELRVLHVYTVYIDPTLKRKELGSRPTIGGIIGSATSGGVIKFCCGELFKCYNHNDGVDCFLFPVFCTDPPEGIRATPLDRAWSHWQASITGPTCSPYEGGVFYLHVQIPHRFITCATLMINWMSFIFESFFSYPIRPPSVRFATKIFHPNISRHGDIGLDCIQHNWSLALTIAKVIMIKLLSGLNESLKCFLWRS